MLGTFRGKALLVLMCAGVAFAQSASVDAATWAAGIRSEYRIAANLSYADDNPRALLDVWWPNSASAKSPVPTAIFIHGGGWMGGDKAGAALWFLPYLEMGWAVVNVEYRGGVGTAPAAVEDCRCALRWVMRNAQRYHFDVHNLVVTGESAGSHLALLTGMLPASAGFERSCPGAEELKSRGRHQLVRRDGCDGSDRRREYPAFCRGLVARRARGEGPRAPGFAAELRAHRVAADTHHSRRRRHGCAAQPGRSPAQGAR